MKTKSAFLALLVSFLIGLPVFSQSGAEQLLGKYLAIKSDTKAESRIEIYKNSAGKFEGKIFWLKEPNNPDGTPKYDLKNSDPEMRKVKSDQVVLLKNFTYDEKNKEWTGGTIYDPQEGKTYKCKMKFDSPTKLNIRGYVGVPALGKTMIWTKED